LILLIVGSPLKNIKRKMKYEKRNRKRKERKKAE